jgi:hypothetical protein
MGSPISCHCDIYNQSALFFGSVRNDEYERECRCQLSEESINRILVKKKNFCVDLFPHISNLSFFSVHAKSCAFPRTCASDNKDDSLLQHKRSDCNTSACRQSLTYMIFLISLRCSLSTYCRGKTVTRLKLLQ